jgi:acid phosphatase (class A)
MKQRHKQLGLTVSLTGLLWSGLVLAEEAATKITDPHFKLAPGYLNPAGLPLRLALLGAPPKPDSAALARDEEARRAALALRGTAREALAATDAELSFPGPANTFSCAMGTQISEKTTPHLYTLMQRTLTDASGSTYAGKNAYNRTRPFVVHDEGTCRKDMEPLLRTDGSWPSGHSAAGWAWGLILAEVNPARATELMTRGPGVWPKPRHLQRPLAKRRGCRAHHGRRHRGQSAQQSGVPEGSGSGEGRNPGSTKSRQHADRKLRRRGRRALVDAALSGDAP